MIRFLFLPEQHSVRHVLDDGLVGRAVLEPDGVADLLPEQAAELLRHALRHRHGRHPPRLSAADLACVRRFVCFCSVCEIKTFYRTVSVIELID